MKSTRWGATHSDGAVNEVPVGGGKVKVLSRGQDYFLGLAVGR
jgi:hypothetical protein